MSVSEGVSPESDLSLPAVTPLTYSRQITPLHLVKV